MYKLLLCYLFISSTVFAIEDKRLKLPILKKDPIIESHENLVNFSEINQTLQTLKINPSDFKQPSPFYIKYNRQRPITTNDQFSSKLTSDYFTNESFENTVFLPDNTQLFFNNNAEVKAGYNTGRFSAETGVVKEQSTLNQGERLYVKGSYHVLSHERFSLLLTARIESLNNNLTEKYFNIQQVSNEKTINETINSSLGIVGIYSLTSRWSVIGSFTSSNYNNDIPKQALINTNFAIIGTSYSF